MQSNLSYRCLDFAVARWSHGLARARTLRSDERGTISILSVIVLLLLTMLMGMIMNVGEQIDDKIKMQNAADAASYSSGVVMARGLNTLAFTNHLLSETFALTAYFREGRDRYAEKLVPDILRRWQIVQQQLGMSDFALIRDIGPAVGPKITMEAELVQAFGDMTEAKARIVLPALETILGMPEQYLPSGSTQSQSSLENTHLIPVFQRAVVLAVADSSRMIATEIAKRNSPGSRRNSMICLIWSLQTDGAIAINERNPIERTLPAVDPSTEGPDFQYLSSGEVYVYQHLARTTRDSLATHYLHQWIDDDNYDLGPFERETYTTGGRVSAKMSQFINLYRGFTCAKLRRLLNEEFPRTNLPHILRQPLDRQNRATYVDIPIYDGAGNLVRTEPEFQGYILPQQRYLDYDFTFCGTAYRKQRRPTMAGMYRVPITGDALATAAFSVYLPVYRHTTTGGCPRFYGIGVDSFYGTSGCGPNHHDSWPQAWSLFSQNWAARLIPSSSITGLIALKTQPPELLAPGVKRPNMDSLELQDLKALNFH